MIDEDVETILGRFQEAVEARVRWQNNYAACGTPYDLTQFNKALDAETAAFEKAKVDLLALIQKARKA